MIKHIEKNRVSYNVIIHSFKDVAEMYNMTKENCPGNSAFMSYEKFMNYSGELFAYGDQTLKACMGIEKKSDVTYKLSMLSVLPSYRKQGIGHEMMTFAETYVRRCQGQKIKLGMIYENQVLFDWYQSLGYTADKIKAYKGSAFRLAFMEKKL
jgi:ribosomal protein S18 acetylase RimI-like enzyme